MYYLHSGEALIADGGLLDSASIDSGRGTGTGFTVSDINLPASGNQPALEPAMSTVTEESLRSSKESRHLHKEYIRNGTVASDNHEDSGIKQQRDELEIIGKDNNFTGGLPQTINETDDTTLTDKTSETDGAEADHKSLEAPEEELKYGTEDSSLKTNQGEDNVERTSGDTMEGNKNLLLLLLLIACHQSRLHYLPLKRLLPEAEKSRSSSTTSFSGLAVVKLSVCTAGNLFVLKLRKQRENSRGSLNRFC